MDIDIKSPFPLAFDKVMEFAAVASHNSLLFNLPTEILAIIVNHLSVLASAEDLASLAFVNSDCRQLARSCQYRTVTFDANSRSEYILEILQREAIERRQNHGRTLSLSLGGCVRRILVNGFSFSEKLCSMRPRETGRVIGDTSEDTFGDDDDDKRNQAIFKLERDISGIYRPNVLSGISSLIHLESVEIYDGDLNQSLLNLTISIISPIRHLSLRRISMKDIIPVIDDSVALSLETLHIDLSLGAEFEELYDRPRVNVSMALANILRLSSASLKFLTLTCNSDAPYAIDEEAVAFSLHFPKLHQLRLAWQRSFGQSALHSLIFTSPQLSTLIINYGYLDTREVLNRKGQIPSLETLVLDQSNGPPYSEWSLELPPDSPLDVLKNNPQLKALGICPGTTTTLIEHAISICGTFSNLKQLSMTWHEPKIPDSSLTHLSYLSSLEDLHLSSDYQIGERPCWYVRHETIINYLKPLQKLKRLAFTSDTYAYFLPRHPVSYECYIPNCPEDPVSHHHLSIRTEALSYAEAFPNLELIYVGQVLFRIRHTNDTIDLGATEEKEFSWLRNFFKISFTT